MDSERPDQYRGVPYLAQVIEPLLQLRRYTESELMAALVQSFFTAWIETETDPSGTPFNEVGTGDIAGVPTASPDGAGASNISDDPNEYEMGPGTVAHLAPGEKVVFGSPNIPTAGFETFVKTICRLVGSWRWNCLMTYSSRNSTAPTLQAAVRCWKHGKRSKCAGLGS